MKVVSKLKLKDLYTLREAWENGFKVSVQAQFIKEGLQLRNNKTGKDLLFPYNKVFESNNHFNDNSDSEECFVHYTKIKTYASQSSKFHKREFGKKGDRYIINGYPFKEEQICILNKDLLELENLNNFVLDYVNEFIYYKEADLEQKEKVMLGNGQDTTTADIYWDGISSTTTDTIMNNETNKEGNNMNKITKIAENAVQINKEALILAAKLEVGKVAIAQLKKVVTPKLPYPVRGYADSPLFNIVLANAVGITLREYAQGNEKAQIVSEAMIQSAAVEMMSSFDINGMINDMLENVDVSKLINLESKSEEG